MPKRATTNAVIVQELADRLCACSPGDIVGNDEIDGILDGRGYLKSAARVEAAKATGAIFAPVKSVGLKRLAVDEAAWAHGSAVLKGTRARHQRAGRMIGHALTKPNNLSDKAIVDGYAMQTVIGLIEHMSHVRTARTKAIEVVLDNGGSAEQTAKNCLEAMRTALGRYR